MRMPTVVVKVMRVPGGYRQFYSVHVDNLRQPWLLRRPAGMLRRSMGVAARKAFYLTLGLGLPYFLYGQNVAEVPKRITEFTLSNGLHFIVAERHDWPLAAFHMVVKAGFADDPAGETGMAYLLERMAFKGTEALGSRDWAAEKKAMEAVEEAYDRWEAEHNKGPKAEEGKLIS